jgi:hypothetical protein
LCVLIVSVLCELWYGCQLEFQLANCQPKHRTQTLLLLLLVARCSYSFSCSYFLSCSRPHSLLPDTDLPLLLLPFLANLALLLTVRYCSELQTHTHTHIPTPCPVSTPTPTHGANTVYLGMGNDMVWRTVAMGSRRGGAFTVATNRQGGRLDKLSLGAKAKNKANERKTRRQASHTKGEVFDSPVREME